MKSWRWFLHPIFGNRRSFSIFLINALAVLITMSYLGALFYNTLVSAAVSAHQFQSGLLSILFSPITHFAIAAAAVAIGTGFTAVYVVGPIKRMEQWLKDWDAGYNMAPLRLRGGDSVYQNIARMMNQLREKNQSQKRPRG